MYVLIYIVKPQHNINVYICMHACICVFVKIQTPKYKVLTEYIQIYLSICLINVNTHICMVHLL